MMPVVEQTKWLACVGGVVLALCACAESARSARTAAPLLQMAAPRDYTHASVILIGDPTATEELEWTDGKARLAVPKSGVVRLKSLGLVDSGQIEAQLDGKDYWRVGAANLHGARVAMFRFSEDEKEPAINHLLESELAKYLSERESEPGADDQARR
jgi:hypothetical protein